MASTLASFESGIGLADFAFLVFVVGVVCNRNWQTHDETLDETPDEWDLDVRTVYHCFVYMQTAPKYNTFYIHHYGGSARPHVGVYTNWCIL